MDFVRKYKKNIVENKNLIFISILLFVAIRLMLFFSIDDFAPYRSEDGVLWSSLFTHYLYSSPWLSFVFGTILALAIASFLAYINIKHNLIRVRSYQVYFFALLLFSANPAFIHINAQYVSVFLLLIAINTMFGSYQLKDTSLTTYSVGFTIAIASLFSFDILFYFVLFWIGFALMHSLNFKSIITFFLGILTIYWLLFSYYLWDKSFPEFVELFSDALPHFGYFARFDSFIQLYSFLLSAVVVLIAVIDNRVNAYQDKIDTRARLAFLNVSAILSILFFFFVSFDPLIDFYVFTCMSVLLVAHLFSIADTKWKMYLFFCFVYMTIIGAVGFAYLGK